MGWLTTLFGFIDPLTKITGQIVDWQVKKQEAQTNRQKIEAEENIDKLKTQQAVILADQSGTIPWGRACLMAPFAIYLWKILVWDKVFDLGSTDNLSPVLWQMMLIIWGFYFVTDLSKIWKR